VVYESTAPSIALIAYPSASSVEGPLADLASEPREVDLKGIQGKVKVQTIRWTPHER
jgi:hypothetical protein